MKLIDRDALIASGKMYSSYEIGVVKAAPTVDAAPVVHGEWIEEHEDDAMTIHRKWVRCSACKSVYSPNVKMNFCPNCGADMRERN